LQGKAILIPPGRSDDRFVDFHFIAPNRTAKRDFFRLAVLAWTTPDLDALSKAELTPRNAAAASSFFPAETRPRYPLSKDLRRDLMLIFRRCFRALFRARRSADFVFGINDCVRF